MDLDQRGPSRESPPCRRMAGLLSLPKECSLDSDYNLILKPAAELTSLRTENRLIQREKLTCSF